MTTKKEGPGKDDARAPQAPQAQPAGAQPGQPKKPFATIELKATEVVMKDAKPAAGSASSVPAMGDAKSSATATASMTAVPTTGAKPADAKAGGSKPTDSNPADPKAAVSKGADPKSSDAGATASRTTDTKIPPAAAKPDTPRRSGGVGSFLSHMAAGIAGGFLALLGADTLAPQMAQLGLPIKMTGTVPDPAEFQKRLAALEQAPRPTAASVAPDIQQKLAATEARLAKLDDHSKLLAALTDGQLKLAADGKAIADTLAKTSSADEAVARVTKLEDRLATMAAAADNNPAAGRVPQLAAITGKVADLETTLNNQMSAIRKSVAEQIESRVTVVAESSEAAKSGTVRMDRDVAALKSETSKLGTRMETLKSDGDRLADAMRTVQSEAGGLRSALDGLKGDIEARLKTLAKPSDVAAAVSPVASKLAALENNLQSVVKSEEDRKANAERIVLSLELGNLKRVLDRGQKYAAELAEVKKAAGGRVDLAALDRYKDTGVATIADLARDFRTVANAVLDAESEPADASVVDRLLAGAKSVVRVRKVSHTADDKSAEAIVGRMEQALRDNRLTDVITEAKQLPPRAVQPAQDWLGKVDARASVDRALAAVDGQLKTSLAGASAAGQPAAAQPAAPAEKPSK
ncbi:MAG: hypothetical protein CTY20_01420 [Hyphomicrobium sp.]|nr:MAG: hypothetical protein CTY20_01420 [Hyphomicrobium sp.]